MSARHTAAVCVVSLALGLGAAACSSTESPDNGAVTNLDKVGPEIAALKLEVQQLRQEVAALQEALASVTTTTTQPLR
jgi:hypothetical protein